jgi:hypothetical protein
MTFGAVDIPIRGVDDFREALKGHELRLAAARKQRDVILNDIRKASDAADFGDQRARLGLNAMNKQDAAVGWLILSLEADVREAKKRLAMAETQAETVKARQAAAVAGPIQRERLFEVACPDGRKVRHHHATADSLQKMLQPGYKVVAEVFGAGIDGNGGFVAPIGSSAPTIMESLLDAFGDQLLAWLASRGIIGSVVVLPSNSRELQLL